MLPTDVQVALKAYTGGGEIAMGQGEEAAVSDVTARLRCAATRHCCQTVSACSLAETSP